MHIKQKVSDYEIFTNPAFLQLLGKIWFSEFHGTKF